MIFRQHLDGINRSRRGCREGIGAATVERYFQRGLQRQFGEWHSGRCPQVLGIDEHFFTRRSGYATTLCDLRNHKIYDVVLGRSELSLEAYFQGLEGKAEVRWYAWTWLPTTARWSGPTSPTPASWPTASMSFV